MIRRPLFLLAVLLAVCCLIFSLFNIDYEPTFKDGESVTVSGKIEKIENKTASKYVYLNNAEINRYSFRRCLIQIYNEDYEKYDLKIGNTIYVLGQYTKFNEARNYGNFDEKYYYHSLNVFVKVRASDIEIRNRSYNWISQNLYDMKNRLTESFERAVNDPRSGIFSAIVTGDKSGLEEETKTLYQESGIAHILAISGLHISLLGMGVFGLLRKKLKFIPAAFLAMLFMACFCIMCGASASALRATIMFGIYLAAKCSGKTYDLLSAMSAALIVILLSNPYYIMNTGFQLSFGAVLAIGIVADPLLEFASVKKTLVKSFILSLSITFFTLPIIASTYYQIPLYSVFLNLIVIPLMSFVLGSGFFSGILGIGSMLAGRFFAGIGFYILIFIEGISELFLYFPYSIINTGNPNAVKIIFFYICMFSGTGFIYLISEKKRKDKLNAPSRLISGSGFLRFAIICVMFVSMLLVLLIKPVRTDLKILMFDVDQGDGIVIISPENNVYMIDGGSTGVDELYRYRLKSALKYECISRIDYEIITHTDTDHLSGVMQMLNDDSKDKIEIGNILLPEISGNENYDELTELAEKKGVNVMRIYAGMQINDGDLTFNCLHPSKEFYSDDVNGYSTVLEMNYKNFSALFTGDLGEDEEQMLIQKGALKHYDMLKVAHHGSKYSSSENFLEAVRPKLAIISAGIDNSYGHPAKETLQRLNEAGASVYCTAWDGEIIVNVDDESVCSVRGMLSREY